MFVVVLSCCISIGLDISICLQENITAGNDIAVLVLKVPLTAGHAAGAVCLPGKPIKEHVGKMATVTGWGQLLNESFASLLQTVDLKILPDCMKTTAKNGYKK